MPESHASGITLTFPDGTPVHPPVQLSASVSVPPPSPQLALGLD